MKFIILAATITARLGPTTTNLNAARAFFAHSCISTNHHTGRYSGNSHGLRIKSGAGSEHPIAASIHGKGASKVWIAGAVDRMRVGWIADVGQSENRRYRETGTICSAFSGSLSKANLPCGALCAKPNRNMVNAAVLQFQVRAGSQTQALD